MVLICFLQNRRSSRARKGRWAALYKRGHLFDMVHLCRNSGVRLEMWEYEYQTTVNAESHSPSIKQRMPCIQGLFICSSKSSHYTGFDLHGITRFKMCLKTRSRIFHSRHEVVSVQLVPQPVDGVFSRQGIG